MQYARWKHVAEKIVGVEGGKERRRLWGTERGSQNLAARIAMLAYRTSSHCSGLGALLDLASASSISPSFFYDMSIRLEQQLTAFERDQPCEIDVPQAWAGKLRVWPV